MKKVFSTILALTLCICLSLTYFAADGDGNGSGGGKNQPLSVESASIQNGDCVLPDSEITLTFSKNVVNGLKRDHLKSAVFALKSTVFLKTTLQNSLSKL